MTRPVSSPYLHLLEQIDWQSRSPFYVYQPWEKKWLLGRGSLSQLMKTYCHTLSVKVLHNAWADSQLLTEDESRLLMFPERFVLRQVLLSGDGCPWVMGRTLISESVVKKSSHDLAALGELPIGELVFQAQHVLRDELRVAKVVSDEGILWARRSRLWTEQQPILVTELFLPEAPVYMQENME
jgi:chorismate--pyruvate lyase